MDGLEHHKHGLLVRQLFYEAARREEQWLAVGHLFGPQPGQDGEMLTNLGGFLGSEQLAHGGRQLSTGFVWWVGLEDARDQPHLPGEGPVPGALAVGEGPSNKDPAPRLLDQLDDLAGQPSLADARRAHHWYRAATAHPRWPRPCSL